jgi:hypothetical protein
VRAEIRATVMRTRARRSMRKNFRIGWIIAGPEESHVLSKQVSN